MPGKPARTKATATATAFGTVGVVLWATETALITFTAAIPPLETVALAFAFAALLAPFAWRLTGDDPRAAFRQPPRVWLVTVGSLVGYHASIYYATQKAPPAAAALLQGTTPLIIVLGSALLPGERLRWWHSVGAGLGFAGILTLIGAGEGAGVAPAADPVFYLSVVGVAAALWGLYSVASRRFGDVPSSALGVFYAASAAVSLLLHAGLETWVTPAATEWAAIAALGLLPMGLALLFWDHGVKRGDIQALGAISYVEPFIGAALVAAVGHGALSAKLVLAGCLVVAGAALASRGLLGRDGTAVAETSPRRAAGDELEDMLVEISLGLVEEVRKRRERPASPREAALLAALAARTLRAWDALERLRAPASAETAARPEPSRRAA